jgi:hypothetical protein
MSKTAYSKIQLKNVEMFKTVLTKLLDLGWKTDDHGMITYLPLGEVDFSWTSCPISSQAQVMAKIEQKLAHEEDIGIVLTFENTNIGGNLVYSHADKIATFSWLINRRETKEGELDFDWYIDRIKPAVGDSKISSFDCDSSGNNICSRDD